MCIKYLFFKQILCLLPDRNLVLYQHLKVFHNEKIFKKRFNSFTDNLKIDNQFLHEQYIIKYNQGNFLVSLLINNIYADIIIDFILNTSLLYIHSNY